MSMTETTRRDIENMIAIHSDMHKEATGVRPHLDIRWDEVEADPDRFIEWLGEKIDYLEDELRADEEDRARRELIRFHEVEAFREKLAKLGLDPEKFLHLA